MCFKYLEEKHYLLHHSLVINLFLPFCNSPLLVVSFSVGFFFKAANPLLKEAAEGKKNQNVKMQKAIASLLSIWKYTVLCQGASFGKLLN